MFSVSVLLKFTGNFDGSTSQRYRLQGVNQLCCNLPLMPAFGTPGVPNHVRGGRRLLYAIRSLIAVETPFDSR
jgi:hypothetical protein